METEERDRTHGGVVRAAADRLGPRRVGLVDPPSEVGSPRGAAGLALRVLGDVADGRLSPLPVAVQFWDGTRLGSDGAAAVVVRNPSAVAHLLRAPGQLGLARAWVDGSLDVNGDLEPVLRARGAFAGVRLSAADRARLGMAALRLVGWRLLRSPPVPAVEARLRGRRQSLARDRDAVAAPL
jgi:cyclopropane-fatty-acyl-phospholipid synthase